MDTYTLQHFSLLEMSSAFNGAAYQVHKYATNFGQWNPEAFLRQTALGIQACTFLEQCLYVTLAERVPWDKLVLLRALRPVRHALEKSRTGGLAKLMQEAQITLGVLGNLHNRAAKRKEYEKVENLSQVQAFLTTISKIYLTASTDVLLRENAYF